LTNHKVNLTEYSHGQGCGCKISPKVLDVILKSSVEEFEDNKLIVGNSNKDDAAVYDLGNGEAVISTTDFFMPIVNDPFTFGRIAATNAISDIYAMGGNPLMAISIFGWPLDKLSPEIGSEVIEGGRKACKDAGIVLAGGHSIDSPEPIFGLSVTGKVKISNLMKNSTAKYGDKIYLTKPIGLGILATAQKQNKILNKDKDLSIEIMCQLNNFGPEVAKIDGVNAITDITGFGLAGHLLEVCLASKVYATINYSKVPIISNAIKYLNNGCIPGGTIRNFESYGKHLNKISPEEKSIVCDPQTSGGLLIMVSEYAIEEFQQLSLDFGFKLQDIGEITKKTSNKNTIEII
jgi:selenide,water dikinase